MEARVIANTVAIGRAPTVDRSGTEY